ncbi:hypothetical protein FCIRC_10388 [Fusarium circinatum]|uniref:Uncharacterized protein n=1 Tax=Fusarium circinatum TaxID=48490 RepID=A0A8H5WMY7_FUSCI|nr:hypothetical protein FCIRC_10388 [Fusarium circinatum]
MRNEFDSRLLDQVKQSIINRLPQDDAIEIPYVVDMDFGHDFAEELSRQIVETLPYEVQDVAKDISALQYGIAARDTMEAWLAIETSESVLGTTFLQKSICQLFVYEETMDHKLTPRYGILIISPVIKRVKFTRGSRTPLARFSVMPKKSSSAALYAKSVQWLHLKWRSDGFDSAERAIAHDELKHATGWYDDDFRGSSTVMKQRHTEAKTQAKRRHVKTCETLAFSAEK